MLQCNVCCQAITAEGFLGRMIRAVQLLEEETLTVVRLKDFPMQVVKIGCPEIS